MKVNMKEYTRYMVYRFNKYRKNDIIVECRDLSYYDALAYAKLDKSFLIAPDMDAA